MNMIRKKKADFLFLYIKKIFVLMLVLIMGLTSVSQNIHAQTQENLLGIESYVNYSDDLQNGTIYLDLQNVDNDNYEIREILDPQMNQLSMEALEYAVTVNGDYIFTVKYIERNQEELKDEKEDDNSIDSALLIDDLHIEEKIKTYELVVTVDGIIDSNTDVDETIDSNTDGTIESNNDVDETIDSNTDVVGTIDSNTDYGVSTVNAVSSDYATREAGNMNLEDVFDVDSLCVLRAANDPIPMKDATNINGYIDKTNNKIVLYNAKENGGIPTSYYPTNTWWQAAAKVDAIGRLSLKSDWEFVYTFKGGSVDGSKGNRGSIYLNFGTDVASKGHDVEIGAMADGRYNRAKLFIWTSGSGETSKQVGNSRFFEEERQIIVTCDYDDDKHATITISCPESGEEVSKTYDVSSKDSVSVAFGGDATWGAGDSTPSGAGQLAYPTEPVTVTFESLMYKNLNPQIEKIQWFKDNIELNSDSIVSPGDTLSVRVTVKNDSAHSDVLPATLFPSDNFDLALTHGISVENSDLKEGISVNLTKDPEPIDFDVTVMDTIGDISLGVMLEDDFFHKKIYLAKQTKISIGQIFADDSPSYTVSNPERGDDGKAKKDANGEIAFEDDVNQLQINQDSYVKVAIDLKNPRSAEDMDIDMSADTTTAPGLDFTTIHRLETTENINISEADLLKFLKGTDKLTFTLGANDSAKISFYVPVKQSTEEGMVGKPVDKGAQEIEYEIAGVFTLNQEIKKGSWTKETTVMDSVTDIDADLTTEIIELQRDQEFDLSAASMLTFEPVTEGLDVSVDFENVETENGGTLADWKLFGLENKTAYAGKVALFAENNKTLGVEVTYNGILTLGHGDNSYKHYTRSGNAVDTPRTCTKEITLKVSGGSEVTPYAFFEIPKSVYLNDWKGIDDAHAGIKAEVKLISDIMPGYTFTIEADNNFTIKNSKNETLAVSLYDDNDASGNPVPYLDPGSTNDTVKIGTINNATRSKTVWYNLVKDPTLAPGENFTGTMQFYITME